MPLAVRGMRELTRTFNQAPKDVKKAYRAELRTIAEPIRTRSQRLALSTIRKMRLSPQWAQMRTGVTARLVYVAPRQKGTHGRGRRRRPNLADLLLDRAMDPALAQNKTRVETDFGHMLDRLVTKWDRDGP